MTNHSQRPGKQVWVDHFEPLQVWRFPFRLENLLLVAPFIGLWSFLLGSFYVGGMIMVVRSALAIYATAGFFFCYLFFVLDYTARGYQSPPKIGGDILNANKGRFIKALALCSMFASIAYTAAFSESLFALTVVTTVLFLPVAVCIIAIQDSFMNAMNPFSWYGFYRNIRFDRHIFRYFTTLVLTGLSIMLLQQNVGWLNIATMSCCVFSFVLMFRSLGVLVHANADGLGLAVRFSPEIEAEQKAENDRRALSDFALSLYQQAEVGRINAAFESYENKLKESKYSSEAALWSILKEWSNSALALRAGQGFIERLVKDHKLREAWDVLHYCFEQNGGEYKLLSGNSTLKITAAAADTKERIISAELLRFFDKDFPQHPETTAALLQAAELLMADAKDIVGAQKLLANIRIKYPETAKSHAFQRLHEATL